jgi:hypothetical protein
MNKDRHAVCGADADEDASVPGYDRIGYRGLEVRLNDMHPAGMLLDRQIDLVRIYRSDLCYPFEIVPGDFAGKESLHFAAEQFRKNQVFQVSGP